MKIFFSGDIANHFSSQQFVSDSLQSIIKEADLAVCNFEGVSPFEGCKDKGMLQTASTAKFISEAGFNLCLLANNHIADFGLSGLYSTISAIEKADMYHIGAAFGFEDAFKPFTFSKNGKTLSIINICEAQYGYYETRGQEYGYAWMGHSVVDDLIREQAALTDYVIVCVHAGLEHVDMPLPQFRDTYKHYCDLGATCVIASHPHVAQGIEKYNDSLICYSLGNYFFPRTPSADSTDPENCSYSLIVELEDNKLSYEVVYHKMDNLRVSLCNKSEVSFDMDILSLLLSEPEYEKYIRTHIDDWYTRFAQNHFIHIFRGTMPNDSLVSKAKYILKYLLNKGSYRGDEIGRNKELLRMMENESYRYLTISAMKKKIKKYEIL